MSAPTALPRTVGHLLDAQAGARGTHPFLICDNRVITYSDAAELSANLARGYIASGLAHGSRVGLLYPNGVEFTIASLAAARIGAVTVPLSTFSTPTEVRFLLRNAAVDILLAAPAYRRQDYVNIILAAVSELDLFGRPPLFSPSVPTLRRVAFDAPAKAMHDEWTVESILEAGSLVGSEILHASQDSVSPADRLVIVHTSGSTAEPKGVIHTHGSLTSHLHVLNALRRYGQEDILFCNSPFFWIGGYAYALLGTLEAGATLVCSNSEEPSIVLDLIEQCRPTLVNGFAQSVTHLAKDPSFPRRDLTSIQRGNLYPIMPDAVRPSDTELHHNMLGMTETGSVCLASDDDTEQPEYRRGSFGRPVSDIEVTVIDPIDGSVVDVGVTGELCLRGSVLMDGYCGRERHETFDSDGWYRSGDLFQVDEDGYFYFVGRLGEMIKTSGANVSPREVEMAVFEETGLVAHVFGIEDQIRGQLVAAAIRIPSTTTAPDPQELKLRLRSRLSAYKVPKRIVMVNEKDLPMMSSGKIDLRALKELAHVG